jgi:hypothetical protein
MGGVTNFKPFATAEFAVSPSAVATKGLWDSSYETSSPQLMRNRFGSAQAQPTYRGTTMLQATDKTRRSTPSSSPSLDEWMYALSLIILRRQMRGKWVGSLNSTGPSAA